MGMTYSLNATPDTVHWGYFDPTLNPVLSIESGDRVRVSTVSGGREMLPEARFDVLDAHRQIVEHVSRPKLPGHILTGPVEIRDALPGDALEIRIIDISLAANWGWNLIRPLAGMLTDDFQDLQLTHIAIDRDEATVTFPWGTKLKAKPLRIATPA